MNEEELLRTYHADFPFSFGGLDKVRDSVNIKKNRLKNVLSKSNIYTEFREFKKPKYFPPVRTYGEDYLWEADLMFFTHPTFAQQNDGNLYILAIIDTFTKTVKMQSLKSKNTTVVTIAVNNLFKNIKPRYLRVDAGGEFISNAFTKMCKDNNVELYIAMEPIKCAIIERFNRTFKRLLIQIMDKNNSLRWVDFLPQALKIYHSRRHRSLKMSPDEADEDINHNKILRLNLKRYAKFDRKRYSKNQKPAKFKTGKFVKLFKKRGYLQKDMLKMLPKNILKFTMLTESCPKIDTI